MKNVLCITAVAFILTMATVGTSRAAGDINPKLWSNLDGKIVGIVLATPNIHACGGELDVEKRKVVVVSIYPPVTITATRLDKDGITRKTYKNLNTLYIKEPWLPGIDPEKLAMMEAADSPTKWQYLMAFGACINEIDQEHLFLTGFREKPTEK